MLRLSWLVKARGSFDSVRCLMSGRNSWLGRAVVNEGFYKTEQGGLSVHQILQIINNPF